MIDVEDPLFGLNGKRTHAGFGILGTILVVIFLQWFLNVFVFIGDRFHRWAIVYDGIALVTTLFVALSLFAGIAYALGNGGPVMVVALSTFPTVFGSLLRLHVVATVDLALAFGAGTCAAWIACWKTYATEPSRQRIDWAIGVAVAVTVLAGGIIRRASQAGGAYVQDGLIVAALLFTVGILLVAWWVLEIGRKTA